MDENVMAVLTLGVIALVPLVPAYVLFRALGSTGDVSGPWGGLQVKFGGAFAGYLVVFLALLYSRPTDISHYHTWHVNGIVQFQHAPGNPDPNVNDVTIRLSPPDLAIKNQGLIDFDVPVEERSDGTLKLPTLQLDLRNYDGIPMPLGDHPGYGVVDVPKQIDRKTRTITLSKPVVMRASAPYADSTSQQPQPLAAAKQ